jgi:ABC-type transporter Mla subunit MlaD
MPHYDSQTIQLIIVAAVALAMLLQSVAMVVALIIARKAIRSMHDDLQDMRNSVLGVIDKVEPVIDGVRDLVAHTAPKIEATVADLAAVSHSLRKQTGDVQFAANEIIERFRHQSVRVDETLTHIFDVVDRANSIMSQVISKPVRQVSAILASAKAVLETLRNGTTDAHGPVVHTRTDKDGYI